MPEEQHRRICTVQKESSCLAPVLLKSSGRGVYRRFINVFDDLIQNSLDPGKRLGVVLLSGSAMVICTELTQKSLEHPVDFLFLFTEKLDHGFSPIF